MRQYHFPSYKSLFLVGLILFHLPTFSQSGSALQITSPYDSIKIIEVKAVGARETRSITVTLQVQSHYHKLASLTFSGGAFDDFGVVDEKGKKYKFFSYSGPPGTDNGINKGYLPIKDLQFGKSKPSLLISVQDTLHFDQIGFITFRLQQADKTVTNLKDVHLLCHLMLNYMNAGQKQFFIKNLPVQWNK